MFSHRPFLLPTSILFLLFCLLLFCFLHALHDVSIVISVIGLLIIVILGGCAFNHFSCFTHALTHVLFLPPLLLSSPILLSISLYIYLLHNVPIFRFSQPSYSLPSTNILWHTIAILKRIEKCWFFILSLSRYTPLTMAGLGGGDWFKILISVCHSIPSHSSEGVRCGGGYWQWMYLW